MSKFASCADLLLPPHYNSRQPRYFLNENFQNFHFFNLILVEWLQQITSSVFGNSKIRLPPAMMWWEGRTTRIVCIWILNLDWFEFGFEFWYLNLDCFNIWIFIFIVLKCCINIIIMMMPQMHLMFKLFTSVRYSKNRLRFTCNNK